MKKSLGLIETIGLTAGIVAADTAVKSANVELIGYELTRGSGMTVIKLEGDVGAVTAAIASAAIAASAVGKVVSCKVIPRPSEGLDLMIKNSSTVGGKRCNQEEGEVPFSEHQEPTDIVPFEKNDIEALKKDDLEAEVIENKPEAEVEEDEPEAEVIENKPEAEVEENKPPENKVDKGQENIDTNKSKAQASKKKGASKKNGQKNGLKDSKVDKDDQENK